MNELDKENLEIIILKINTKGKIEQNELLIYETDEEIVLNMKIDDITYLSNGEYIFEALQNLRKKIENKNIMLLCNGAVVNIYPSLMQKETGGTKAYKLVLGEQASLKNVVDIFDYDEKLEIGTVDEQEKFYKKWLMSIEK